MNRKNKIRAVFLALIAVIATFFFVDFRFGPDFRINSKVIDPRLSSFNPENFSLDDYATPEEVLLALSHILPTGTSFDNVREFMSAQKELYSEVSELNQTLKLGGSREPSTKQLYYRLKKSFFCPLSTTKTTNLIASFSDDLRLIRFHLETPCKVVN